MVSMLSTFQPLYGQIQHDDTPSLLREKKRRKFGCVRCALQTGSERLWLDRLSKPVSVEAELAAVEVQIGRQGATSKWEGREPARYERRVSGEMVRKLCEQGQVAEAVEGLGVLVHGDALIPQSLFYTVLKECVARKDLSLSRRVHALIVKEGSEEDTFLCNHILRMYASQGRLQEAMDVFERVSRPDAFTWSAIISANVKQGEDKQAIELYHRMRGSSVKPDGHVFVAALQACARGADFKSGQEVHADVLARGVERDSFVCSGLVDMYAKCGSLEDAQRVFDGLPQKDVVTWNAMIAGYSQQGRGQEALSLYSAMQEEGMAAPNSVTYVCVLQACASVGSLALEKGKQLHAQIRERGLQADVVVGGSLVNMYTKCGSLKDARDVFDGLGQKSVVTWNVIIAGYSQQIMGLEALGLYRAMQEDEMAEPDAVTFASLLQACASVGTPALEQGKQIHAQIRKQGLLADVIVANSLVNMYAKCGSLEDAQAVFDGLGDKTVVTWSAMIAGYSLQGMGHDALRLYNDMQNEGLVAPNSVTFLCLLQACASVAALHLGRQLHQQIKEQGLQADLLVAASLINMYGKCSSLLDAQQVFDALAERDVATWNALIAGYTRQGDSTKVFDLVLRMRKDHIQPDSITYVNLLTVCSHTGLVSKGREYFDAMSRDYGITPTPDHYTCMVGLLGRAGQVQEALAFLRTMPVSPDAGVWHTLLGACQKWNNVEVGRHAFDEALKLDAKDAAAYVLMFNIYTSAQMWEQAEEMQVRRKENRAWKEPGQSWWTDMDGLVHSFLVGCMKDPECEARLEREMSPADMLFDYGYENHLFRHSEKLAIPFDVNKTSNRSAFEKGSNFSNAESERTT